MSNFSLFVLGSRKADLSPQDKGDKDRGNGKGQHMKYERFNAFTYNFLGSSEVFHYLFLNLYKILFSLGWEVSIQPMVGERSKDI